ncbi:hypothetical protein VTN96DRAFT_231 [Rasamsonia emersonii]
MRDTPPSFVVIQQALRKSSLTLFAIRSSRAAPATVRSVSGMSGRRRVLVDSMLEERPSRWLGLQMGRLSSWAGRMTT